MGFPADMRTLRQIDCVEHIAEHGMVSGASQNRTVRLKPEQCSTGRARNSLKAEDRLFPLLRMTVEYGYHPFTVIRLRVPASVIFPFKRAWNDLNTVLCQHDGVSMISSLQRGVDHIIDHDVKPPFMEHLDIGDERVKPPTPFPLLDVERDIQLLDAGWRHPFGKLADAGRYGQVGVYADQVVFSQRLAYVYNSWIKERLATCKLNCPFVSGCIKQVGYALSRQRLGHR